jgi:hypothetical protein
MNARLDDCACVGAYQCRRCLTSCDHGASYGNGDGTRTCILTGCGVTFPATAVPCPHDWMQRGTDGDLWRECFLCGKQESS